MRSFVLLVRRFPDLGSKKDIQKQGLRSRVKMLTCVISSVQQSAANTFCDYL